MLDFLEVLYLWAFLSLSTARVEFADFVTLKAFFGMSCLCDVLWLWCLLFSQS